MGCNPDDGTIRMFDEHFNLEEAVKQGYTEVFHIGEIITIKECYFEVNNFVEEHSFMNLKLLKNEDALERLTQELKTGESFG